MPAVQTRTSSEFDMGMLSSALRKYYRQTKSSMIFGDKYSLNALSLRMWEEIGYTSIDPSILSKVVSGKRLFTPLQLEAFSKSMGLSSSEKEYAFFCLQQDYLQKKGVTLHTLFSPTKDIQTFIESAYETSYALYFNGDCHGVLNSQDSVIEFIHAIQEKNPSNSLEYIERASELLFLQAWAVGCVFSSSVALSQLSILVSKLVTLQRYASPKMEALIAYIRCLTQYVTAEYAYGNTDSYERVILYGQRVIENVDDINKVALAARKVVIAATRIGDAKILDGVVGMVEQKLQHASAIRNTSGLMLMKNSFANSLSKTRSPVVKRFIEDLEKHVHTDFKGKHTYAISNMKDRVEHAIANKIELRTLRNDLQRALIVSDEEGFTKQRNKIIQLVRSADPNLLTSLNIQI